MSILGITSALPFYKRVYWQLFWPLSLALLTAGVVGGLLILNYIEDEHRARLMTEGRLTAHSVQFATESASNSGAIQRYVAAIGAEEEIDFALVVAGDPPRVIASTELISRNQNLKELPDEVVRDMLVRAYEDRVIVHRFVQDDDVEYIYYAIPTLISNIVEDGKPLKNGALIVIQNGKSFSATFRKTLYSMVGGYLLLLLAIAFMVVWLVQRFVLRPQSKLMNAMSLRQEGHKTLAQVEGSNEFAILATAFNHMLSENDRVERIKNEFISTVSHELRTPLTAIQGSLSILESISGQLEPQPKQMVDIANRNCQRLLLLINDLLDLEKISSGQMEFVFHRMSLNTICRKGVEATQGYADQFNVKVELSLLQNDGDVYVDEHRILQVLNNLLSNAIKFSEQSGVVRLVVQDGGDRFRVSVVDNGRGIPEEFRSRIFTRFAQADSSDTRDRNGTGLGLSISKLIIDHHQGNIGFASKLGEGAEFFFELDKMDCS